MSPCTTRHRCERDMAEQTWCPSSLVPSSGVLTVPACADGGPGAWLCLRFLDFRRDPWTECLLRLSNSWNRMYQYIYKYHSIKGSVITSEILLLLVQNGDMKPYNGIPLTAREIRRSTEQHLRNGSELASISFCDIFSCLVKRSRGLQFPHAKAHH